MGPGRAVTTGDMTHPSKSIPAESSVCAPARSWRRLPRALLVASVAVLGLLAGACSPCTSLEESICEDLGDEDCAIWRDVDRPGLPNGRRAFRSCVNASIGSGYDLTLEAARASVDAMKKAQSTAN